MSDTALKPRKIHVLDKKVAELIAAGEVVERPASAVKEMLENSIDAGSSMITLEIKNGGVTFIRVTDNGCGIERDDVKTAFLRHATSKVRTEDDLSKIGTLGFRGEALASISAVSKTELITRTENELAGTHLVLEGGETVSLEDAGCARGTTIIVRELFYNTPARMKFLKKDSTEGNAVAAVIQRIALSHPEISFRFIKDGREDLHTPGDNKLLSAIHSVLGRDFAKSLFPIAYTLGHIEVSGFVTKPLAARHNRNMEFFFLNGRLVKSKTMMAAVEEAYKNNIMVGKYPGCVIELTMNPSLCDVNVHPAKLEVRFSDEKDIFRSVYYACKNALLANDERPELDLDSKPMPTNGNVEFKTSTSSKSRFSMDSINSPKKPFEFRNVWQKTASDEQLKIILSNNPQTNKTTDEQFKNIVADKNSVYENQKVEADDQFNNILTKNTRDDENKKTVSDDKLKKILANTPHAPESEKLETMRSTATAYYEPVANSKIDIEYSDDKENSENTIFDPRKVIKFEPKVEETPEIPKNEEIVGESDKPIRVVGQAFGTYILAQKGESLYIIDKHAAHERILYEKIKKNTTQVSQMLLEPVTVKLTAEEYSAIMTNLDILADAGISAEDFGNSTIIVRSAPLDLAGKDISDLIEETAGLLIAHKKDITPAKLDWIFHSVACRAAIKAHDRTTPIEMEKLATDILSSKDIMYCPHGRPVAFELKKSELEKKFGR